MNPRVLIGAVLLAFSVVAFADNPYTKTGFDTIPWGTKLSSLNTTTASAVTDDSLEYHYRADVGEGMVTRRFMFGETGLVAGESWYQAPVTIHSWNALEAKLMEAYGVPDMTDWQGLVGKMYDLSQLTKYTCYANQSAVVIHAIMDGTQFVVVVDSHHIGKFAKLQYEESHAPTK